LDNITIQGARTHNLKNVNLILPRDQLIVITGLSGSGKSSLAFDTLYAEGQRRYVESLSAYARQFLSLMEKPDVDHIEGLSPAISIEQKSTSHNPRSTVGTITEIYDYLRLLFARVGEPRCPKHNITLAAQTISQMVDDILTLPAETKLMILAPVVQDRKGEYVQLFQNLQAQGYLRARVNGKVIELSEPPVLDRYKKHTIEAVIDRLKVREENKQRLAESLETAVTLSGGTARVASMDGQFDDRLFSANHACPQCGYAIDALEPKMFSFNSPAGACSSCDGLGVKAHFDVKRVVHDPTLPINQGAIRGWTRSNLFHYNLLKSVAEHYDFDLDTPFNELPEKIQQVILYGSGNESIKLLYLSHRGRSTRHKPFEGVIPSCERRYREAESNIIREELGKLISNQPCPDCHGTRLNEAARHIFIDNTTLPDIVGLSISNAHDFFAQLKLSGAKAKIAAKILKEIQLRLQFLINVGLDYLTLSRRADTLSGGEAQRIRLASQIGAGLVGVMYILDEPSIGLHQRDNQRLLDTLFHLRDLGNTVIVVEHDEDAIRQADHVVDIGPGAGTHGGRVVAQGTPQTIMQCTDSLTGQYLSGQQVIEVPKKRLRFSNNRVLSIIGAAGNNLQTIDVDIPLGVITCITGVSGSGKSTLINRTLFPAAAIKLNGAATVQPAPYEYIAGFEHLDKVVDIDQSPIGRTPRSNPATYVGVFTLIRELFAGTQEARARGYKPGRFSFNVKGGRCEACQGDGVIKVEMHFLPDVYVPCDLCHGKRYNRETLQIQYKGKSIHDVLDMTIEEAAAFFENVPGIANKLQTLMNVGLSYIHLGQRATTLSGGEAQRVKLAKELSKRDTGNTLYILDEPTTGLHFHDIKQLLAVLQNLRDRGNTIVIIEHNLDVVKTADWIIDLGPEGGSGGGSIVATGTPEQVAKNQNSYTGKFLKSVLG
jgi:excinuclease ABC subunit A